MTDCKLLVTIRAENTKVLQGKQTIRTSRIKSLVTVRHPQCGFATVPGIVTRGTNKATKEGRTMTLQECRRFRLKPDSSLMGGVLPDNLPKLFGQIVSEGWKQE